MRLSRPAQRLGLDCVIGIRSLPTFSNIPDPSTDIEPGRMRLRTLALPEAVKQCGGFRGTPPAAIVYPVAEFIWKMPAEGPSLAGA